MDISPLSGLVAAPSRALRLRSVSSFLIETGGCKPLTTQLAFDDDLRDAVDCRSKGEGKTGNAAPRSGHCNT